MKLLILALCLLIRLCDGYNSRKNEISGEKTFRLFKQLKTWYEARESCMDEGGQLAVIENEHDESKMQILIKEATSIWLHVGFHMLFVDCVTIDGKPLVYQRWDALEPNGNFKTQPCGGIVKWNAYLVDNDCNWRFNYVCEFKEEKEENTKMKYIINHQLLTWPDARRNCASLGGHLLLLTTELIFSTIKDFAKEQNVDRFWIGYHNMFKSKGIVMDTGKSPQSDFIEWNSISELPGYASMHKSGQITVEKVEAKRQSICAIPRNDECKNETIDKWDDFFVLYYSLKD